MGAYVIVGFVIALILFVLVNESDKWAVVVSSVTVITMIIVAHSSNFHQGRQTRTDTLFRVFELLSSIEQRESRKKLYDAFCAEYKDCKKPIKSSF